jgi:hypothetical protein
MLEVSGSTRPGFDGAAVPTGRRTTPRPIRRAAFTGFGFAACIVLPSFVQKIVMHWRDLNPEARRIHRRSVDLEMSVGAWCSCLLLALGGLALLCHGTTNLALSRTARARWPILPRVCLLLSLDKAVAIHEVLKRLLPALNTSGLFCFAWVVPPPVIVPPGLLACLPFTREFSPSLRRLLLLSVSLFLGGSIGMEMLAADWVSQGNGGPNGRPMFQVFAHVEDALEIAG